MPAATADDLHWMRRALHNAYQGRATPGCNPIGCVIVRDAEMIGEGFNEVERQSDLTAHSEVVAMRNAGRRLQCADLRGATLYTTLQPCGMCRMAAIWAKVGRIDVHDMYFEDRHLDTIDFIHDAYRDDITLLGGVMAAECAALYVPRGARVPKDKQFNR